MNILIVFDVSGNNLDLVKNKLKENGYYSGWNWEGRSYILPNNCMWKMNTELVNGKSDIENAINSLNASGNAIVLEKLIVLQATPWVGKESPLHSSE